MTKSTKEGHFFMIIGPSGSGKGTLIRFLLENIPELKKVISHTTRPPRKNEINNVDYYFISKPKYLEMLNNYEFIMHFEYEVNGEFYGTSKKEITENISNNKFIIDETDENSVKEFIKSNFLKKNQYSFIYILPPTIEESKKRIIKRDESKENLEKLTKNIKERLTWFEKNKNLFDLVIQTNNLEESKSQLKEFILKT